MQLAIRKCVHEGSHSHSIVIAIFFGQLCPRGKGAMRLSLCKAPTHERRPDHNTGNYVP